jgi:hypothetical protein
MVEREPPKYSLLFLSSLLFSFMLLCVCLHSYLQHIPGCHVSTMGLTFLIEKHFHICLQLTLQE